MTDRPPVRRRASGRARALAASVILFGWGAAAGLAPAASATPAARLEVDADSRAPLAAELVVETAEPTEVALLVEEGERRWRVVFAAPAHGETRLPVLGMRPDRAHMITLQTRDDDGGWRDVSSHAHRTPGLPESTLDFPPIEVRRAEPDKMEPGLTLFSARRRAVGRPHFLTPAQRDFSTRWSAIVAMDETGEVVWWYRSASRVAGIEMLANGHLLFHETNFSTKEIAMTGALESQWYAELRPQGPADNPDAIAIKGVETLHHQPHETPSGTFLAFTANAQLVEEYRTSEYDPDAPRADMMVMGDKLIEFDRAGNILWSWDTFDHLDPHRIGYQTFWPYWWVRGFDQHADWTHGNGLTYDADDDAVIFSLRNQDAVLKVDRASGEIVWILGEHRDWPAHLQDRLLTPVGELQWPYHQHNPRFTPGGNIIMFDNGLFGTRPFYEEPVPPNQAFSRGVEFAIDEEAMTVRQVWASHDAKDETSCFATAMSDAHKLPRTGNHLVFFAFCMPQDGEVTYDDFDYSKRHLDEFPFGGFIREYGHDPDDPLVFEASVKDPHDLIQWEIYGGLKVEDLYGPSADVEWIAR
ncbi:MAG: aryl-sulfate sulfotransferase [Caulobacterales bacterium]|nr:aryl-sulfate sulfotransferase [Caulobacterales bacterium]